LITFVQSVILVLVALAPWTPVIALVLGGAIFVARRTMQRTIVRDQSGKTAV
jgi:hypothetical protein